MCDCDSPTPVVVVAPAVAAAVDDAQAAAATAIGAAPVVAPCPPAVAAAAHDALLLFQHEYVSGVGPQGCVDWSCWGHACITKVRGQLQRQGRKGASTVPRLWLAAAHPWCCPAMLCALQVRYDVP